MPVKNDKTQKKLTESKTKVKDPSDKKNDDLKTQEKNSNSKKKSPKKTGAKLSYQNDFYSDLTLQNMLTAKIVRCPAQKGIIKSVSLPDLPDGYFLVTARDIPGANIIDIEGSKVSIFCNGNISYLGEPIGLLVGPDSDVIDVLMSEIVVEIDKKTIEDYLDEAKLNVDEQSQSENETNSSKSQKTIQGSSKSKKNKTQSLDADFFSSELASRKILWPKNANISEIFENSPVIAEHSYSYSLSIPNNGEPNGALCSWKDGILTVYTPTQWISNLRYMLSTALKIESSAISIKKTRTFNHGSNSIWYNSVIACQVAAAALKTKKTVKLVYTRQEQNNFIDALLPVNINHKTAASEDGKIQAMKIDIEADAGFFNPFAKEILDRLVIAAAGSIKPKALEINASIRTSNNPAASINLQLVDAASFFALENQLNFLAEKCSLSPLEIRIINGIPENQIKLKRGKKDDYPFLIEINKFEECINAAAKISDFNRKYASYSFDAKDRRQNGIPSEKAAISEPPLRGIGFACAWSGNAFLGSNLKEYDQAMELSLDSESNVIIHCPPISRSIFEIWVKIITETLEISSSKVKLNSEFEPGEEPLLPENIYSNIGIMTMLLKKCLVQIKKYGQNAERPFVVKRKLTPAQKKEWNSENFCGKPFYSTSFGVAVLELELDTCTYREKIKSITLVLNAGKVINIKAAESSIKLAVQKVMESLVENESLEYPRVNINFMQSDENPMQVSDLVKKLIPAAYTQSLSQVLNSSIDSLPLQLDTIYSKFSEQKEQKKEENQDGISNNA